MLPKEAIDEFKKIYKEEFGDDLSDSEATEKAAHVFNLFRVICEPDNKDHKLGKD